MGMLSQELRPSFSSFPHVRSAFLQFYGAHSRNPHSQPTIPASPRWNYVGHCKTIYFSTKPYKYVTYIYIYILHLYICIMFHGPDHGHRFPVVGEHQSFDVHVVGAYRHLGGIIHHSGSQSREAQQRLAVAHQTFSRHRKLLLQNPGIPLAKRRELFESLVMSAFTYGMESWCFMDQQSKSMVHNGIMKLYKRFLKHPHDVPVTDEQVLASSGLPSPSEVLRRARLRYLGTLYACGPAAEWGLLFSDKSWRELVRDDLSWLWRQLWNSSALEDPSLHFPAWEYLLRYHRGYWKRLVTRGMKHAVQQRKNRVWVGDFHQRVFHHLQEQGELGAKEAAYVSEFADSAFFGCMRCGVKCATRAGEGAHFFKVHGCMELSILRVIFLIRHSVRPA